MAPEREALTIVSLITARFAAPATGSGSAIRRLASGEPLPDMPQIESQSNKTVPSDQHAKESDHA